MTRFARYAWTVLACNVAVILWGAIVRATGSGAGCGAHWPLCNGEVVPRAAALATRIEFAHRLSSGLALLLVIGLTTWAFRAFAKGHAVRRAAAASLVFIVGEAAVGAGLVLFELVADNKSMARAMFMGTHLMNTFLLLGSLALTAHLAGQDEASETPRGSHPGGRAFALGLVGMLLVGASGSVAALGDTLFPSGSLQQALAQDLSPTSHAMIRLRVWHPMLAVTVGVCLIGLAFASRGAGAAPARYSRLLARLVIAQLLAGAANIMLLAPIWVQIVHLLLADLVWITLVLLTASALPRWQPARARLAAPVAAAVILASLASPASAAQAEAGPDTIARLSEAAPADQAADLVYGHRTLATLRARVLTRNPSDRAAAAVRRLDGLVGHGVSKPVRVEVVEGAALFYVADVNVFAIVARDVDELAGETLEAKSREAQSQLERALGEVEEARSPGRLARDTMASALATALFALAMLLLVRVHRAAAASLSRVTAAQLEKRLSRGLAEQLMSSIHVIDATRRLVGGGAVLIGVLGVYAWLTYVLREFPYTRPWGESLGGFVMTTVRSLAAGALGAIPGLFAVTLIFLLTRVLARFATRLFKAVELGRLALPGVHPDTSQATRRLVVALLWVFALVASYPYLPGSQTDAFKGVSVLIGLMVSLGSSGLVNQVMSSLVIVYSRSLKVGEFVRIGDVEGTVLRLGVLSTKLRTLWNEEVTLPNAVVASSTTTNYSRREAEGVLLKTSVTIGYDTPWRQVEALLLQAATRTKGICPKPQPAVVQVGLRDFYVAYDLLVSFERQQDRLRTFDELHRNIQDAFNENGVQIMSPNYVLDPKAPKVVPPERWYGAPARKPDAQ